MVPQACGIRWHQACLSTALARTRSSPYNSNDAEVERISPSQCRCIVSYFRRCDSHLLIGHAMEFTGLKRWIAVHLIGLSVVWICVSYAAYGLKAQASLQLSLIIPLLFAGLLLGRVAVWLRPAQRG